MHIINLNQCFYNKPLLIMKKILLSATMLIFLVSCNNEETAVSNETSKIAERGCASHEVHEEQLRQNPELALKMNEIEAFTEKAMQEGKWIHPGLREQKFFEKAVDDYIQT